VTRPEAGGTGQAMYDLVSELFPICRSITGEGFRETLRIVAKEIPLQVHEVASGTPVFDWVVPREWNIRDAYVKDATGRRVIDFRQSNLHVVSYSIPVNRTMALSELRRHLHTLPEQPDRVPYRTAYYAEDWGFCLSNDQLTLMADGDYDVCIDSTLAEGHLTYGEHYVRGQIEDEILISCHACHPSLANDNLSGIAVATFLAKRLSEARPRYSYRFLLIPGTIGSITWLARHEEHVSRIRHGLVLALLGDSSPFTYKRSRRGGAEIDRVMAHVLERSARPYRVVDFSPYGYDERQYCSPGFDLPVGCLNRSTHGQFPEYHTSADDLDFVSPQALEESLEISWEALGILESNRRYVNLNPKCEPQLGRRGLYGSIGGRSDAEERQLAMLWVLNLSDGGHTLLDIAERSGVGFWLLVEVAEVLRLADLMAPAVS
jgi:aminopeptidase-like protein